MSRMITVSDEVYAKLEAEARMRGLESIEQFLEQWQTPASESLRRRELVQHIDDLRDRLLAKYGEMPDSVDLLREDRARS
jgi:predicted CopG family antitoxin